MFRISLWRFGGAGPPVELKAASATQGQIKRRIISRYSRITQIRTVIGRPGDLSTKALEVGANRTVQGLRPDTHILQLACGRISNIRKLGFNVESRKDEIGAGVTQ